MYIYICMYACIYIYVCMHVCMYVCICMCSGYNAILDEMSCSVSFFVTIVKRMGDCLINIAYFV